MSNLLVVSIHKTNKIFFIKCTYVYSFLII